MMSALKLCKCHCIKALGVSSSEHEFLRCLPPACLLRRSLKPESQITSDGIAHPSLSRQTFGNSILQNRSLGIANTSLISQIYRNTSIFVNNHVDHLLHHETWILDAIKPTLTDRVRGMFGIMGSGAAPRKSFVNRKYKSIKQRNARKRKNRKQKCIKEE